MISKVQSSYIITETFDTKTTEISSKQLEYGSFYFTE